MKFDFVHIGALMSKNKNLNGNALKNTSKPAQYSESFISASLAIKNLGGASIHDKSLSDITKNLLDTTDRSYQGDDSEIEMMLLAQAKTLEHFFYESLNMMVDCNMLPQMQAFADIALKAQNQSRRTLTALAEVKRPKSTMFVKQQNNAINQQINHSTSKPKNNKTRKRINGAES